LSLAGGHLIGDPADLAARATAFLESASALLLTDLVLAQTVYVLESFYRVAHEKVAEAMRSLIAFKAVLTVDPALLLRALEVYEIYRLAFAEAYLVASAEAPGPQRSSPTTGRSTESRQSIA
jgi:predicted nucleic-acid-binding protein